MRKTTVKSCLRVALASDTGKVTNWGMEMGGPNGLLRAGWTRNSMKPGDGAADAPASAA
jgi:hypothetical protein